MAALLAQSEIPCALLFTGPFSTGPVYLWTGMGPLSWDDQTWVGIGTLGGLTPSDDGSTVEAKGIAVTLSGIDPTTFSDVLGEFLLGAPMTVYLAGFNGGGLIDSPIPLFVGRMDQPAMTIGAESAIISINCENRLIDMNTSGERRDTADDQQRDWPGDLGMNFVYALQEKTWYWGTAPTSSGNI